MVLPFVQIPLDRSWVKTASCSQQRAAPMAGTGAGGWRHAAAVATTGACADAPAGSSQERTSPRPGGRDRPHRTPPGPRVHPAGIDAALA